jgi:hypothetical protein
MRYICGRCGAHLDPGERCDCMDGALYGQEGMEGSMATGSSYTAAVALPSGKRRTLTYDYRTKEVELI